MKIIAAENPDFLNDYIRYLKIVKNLSPRTVWEYYSDIRMFFRFMLASKTDTYREEPLNSIPAAAFTKEMLQSVTLNDIYEFSFYLADERGNKEKARARKIAALRNFFKYSVNYLQLLKTSPAANLEMPAIKKSLPVHLTLSESRKLLSATAAMDTAFLTRDYCIMVLLLNCGMRLSELIGLNQSSINLAERRMKLLGKGNKERMVYLNDACVAAIKDYLNVRGESSSERHALFLSQRGTRISKRRVQQIVETALQKAALNGQGFSPHKLRHTAATLMYQHGGADTLVLKEILGHKSITTTEIYTHVSNKKLLDAAMNSPLANVKKEE